MTDAAFPNVGGIVLCGGKSTRMGRPKSLLPFGSELMLQRVVRILSEVVSPIVVVAAPGQELPPLPPEVLVAYDEHDALGPLAGLAAGLAALRGKADAAYVSSCDVPLLKPEFIRAMLASLGSHDLAIPRDGKFHHPLAAVYRTKLMDRVRGLIEQGRLRPLFLVQESDSCEVDVETLRAADPELHSLRNTNTPEEYAAALAILPVPAAAEPLAGAGAPRAARGDVRMRGFIDRARVETALAWVDQNANALSQELVPLEDAHGRVLAQDAVAAIDVPAFPRSAMDGYALRGMETIGASDYNPLSFQIVGESYPGRPFAGEVLSGTAVRIMTGAPLPAGADAVLPAEFAQEAAGQVAALSAVSPGKHVGRTGEDVSAGRVIAERVRRLRPQDVGLLASVGLALVPVVRQPRIRIIATGNELAAPGTPRGEYQIVDSNSSMLAGLVARDGGIVESRCLLPDQRETIRQRLLAPGADVILISGGSSVGAEDHAPTLIAAEGELAIHGVAMRPSSPAGMGRVGGALVFLLPGNPVSCLCAYDFFAGRAIRKLGGRGTGWPYVSRQYEAGRKFVSAVGRVDYARVRIVEDRIEPLGLSGASILSSTTRADGFVIIPEEHEGYPPGTKLTVYLYDVL